MDTDLVHAPLARWAQQRPMQIAIDNGQQALTFAQLHDRVQAVVQQLDDTGAGATVWVSPRSDVVTQLVECLAIMSSGRCAAVADPDWPDPVAQKMQSLLAPLTQAPLPRPCPEPLSPFYIGFTSGSTGLPKGFRRHHRSWVSSFNACLDVFGDDVCTQILAPGRPSHSLFLFGMLLGIWTGGGTVVQERFSAGDTLRTLQTGQTPCLIAVPSQLLVLLSLAQRRSIAPVEHVRLVLISGARWMRERTPALRALFPRARVVEFYGASETSFMTWMDADETANPMVVGQPFPGVEIEIRPQGVAPEAGMIYVRSRMLFDDYVGSADEQTGALREHDWLSVRDMGQWDAQGRLCLLGRQNRMLVTQGKNLFPEEVESVLTRCAGVAQAAVLGLPDHWRGQQVVAIVQARAGMDQATLQHWCRQHLEPHKVPRRFWRCTDWPLTPGGKTDHPALHRLLEHSMHASASANPLSCLHPLH